MIGARIFGLVLIPKQIICKSLKTADDNIIVGGFFPITRAYYFMNRVCVFYGKSRE